MPASSSSRATRACSSTRSSAATPRPPSSADEVDPTHILLTHGHEDHYGDIEEIAKRTGAPVVAIAEIARELGEAGVENVSDPNLGGTVKFDWGWVQADARLAHLDHAQGAGERARRAC